jgi:hypothetical protein
MINGIYSQEADVYLDPWRPVKNAIMTPTENDKAYAITREGVIEISIN